jgi:hypothetical protein
VDPAAIVGAVILPIDRPAARDPLDRSAGGDPGDLSATVTA